MNKPNMSLTKTPLTLLDLTERTGSFNEVELCYTVEQATEEASRCLNCPGRYCAASCPIHTPIPEFIAKIREGDFVEAYRLIAKVNPIPEITCRVCPQERQCEQNCTRGIRGEPTAIGRLERFVAEQNRGGHIETQKTKSNGKRVAVIGSGPAGLVCAEDLAKNGYSVEVYEAADRAGGVPVHAIPRFVLPDEIMEKYLRRLADLGVVIHTDRPIGEKTSALDLMENGNDAVFVATGSGRSVALGLEGEALKNVYTAEDYLRRIKAEPDFGYEYRRVAVIGGGNTAVDVCRSAIRLGAEKVHLIYRRDREEMPARNDEIRNAGQEGTEFLFMASPVRILGETHVMGLECVRTEFTEPDYPGGRRNTVSKAGTEFTLEADMVVTALGYLPTAVAGLPIDETGYIIVEWDGVTTTTKGVFAGGDVTGKTNSLVSAVASGKKAAEAIGLYLSSIK